MSDFTISHATDEPTPSLEIHLYPPRAVGYQAVIGLGGEHDLTSASALAGTLRGIRGTVLVDLTRCAFIDSTIISVLIRDHQSRLREGQRLELRVPAGDASIRRILDVCSIGDLLTVHTQTGTQTGALEPTAVA